MNGPDGAGEWEQDHTMTEFIHSMTQNAAWSRKLNCNFLDPRLFERPVFIAQSIFKHSEYIGVVKGVVWSQDTVRSCMQASWQLNMVTKLAIYGTYIFPGPVHGDVI